MFNPFFIFTLPEEKSLENWPDIININGNLHFNNDLDCPREDQGDVGSYLRPPNSPDRDCDGDDSDKDGEKKKVSADNQ